MLYSGMPEVGERAAVAYEQAFFGDAPPKPDGTPSDAGIANAARNIADQFGPPWFASSGLAIMDVESWSLWPFVEGPAHAESIDRYASTASRFRRATGLPTCAYGVAPQAGQNWALWSLQRPDVRDRWTVASDVARDVFVPTVDALCPTLYVPYRNREEDWRRFAIATIAEARRIAPDKPVYPFVWPQFHEGGGVSGYPFLPKAYWRVVLETMRDHADGLVLWGGYDIARKRQLPFDASADWWAVMRDVFPEVTNR